MAGESNNTNRTVAIAVVVLLLAAGWGFLFSYNTAPVDPAWELAPGDSVPAGAVTVRFAGTSTLLVSDGRTEFMFDGWFSRPGPLTTLFGKIAPDPRAISFGLEAMEVGELDAIIPLHSHYDHAMDSAEVARRTGATVYGSEATANICRGWNLPEAQIAVMADRAPFQLGKFVITPIESRHFQFADPAFRERALGKPDITEPLVPPAKAFDYRLGKAYVIHVWHPQGAFMVVGSAGYVPGQLAGMDVDAILLGIGGLGSQTAEYREQYWAETVGQAQPERVIFIHWDSLFAPLDGPLVGEVRLASFLAAGTENMLPFLKRKEAEQPDISFQTLPRFAPVVLFSPP